MLRDRATNELDLVQRAFDEFGNLFSPERSSTTSCCGANCVNATATTSKAAWAPTPSRTSSTASISMSRK